MANVVGTDNPEVLNAADGVTNGSDEIYGLDGIDWIFGLGGNDLLKGGGGADYLDGGTGNDTANYTDSTEGVSVSLETGDGTGGTAEGDVLVNIENLTGSSHDDVLIGDAGANVLNGWTGDDSLVGLGGADTLIGDNGDDMLKGGGGADTLDGGSGNDTASYIDSAAGVRASLTTGVGQFGDAQGDTYIDIENLIGSAHADTLHGDSQANVLSGQAGDDIIEGNGGDDTLRGNDGKDALEGGQGKDDLIGGAKGDSLKGGGGKDKLRGEKGNDELKGGGGKDKFYFDTALSEANNVDTIKDFKVNKDKIVLDSAIFSNVGNQIGNGEFVVGSSAQDDNDWIIYNENNGKLFHDFDGAGGAGKVLFARLDVGLNLDAQDFLVI